MEEWKQDKLIDLLDSLIDYRGKTPRKVDKGIPLITAKIVKNGRIDMPTEFIDIKDYNSWMVRGFPKNGDVILTTEAPLGEVAQLDDKKIALAQRIVCLRGKEGVLDNTFLKYFLLSSLGQARLKARETGTTVTGIKQSELKEVLIDYPPYKYQKQITSILKSLDDKIELNRRINENLEQQAQALFKSWFVDFEPFKDGKFVDSELGMIPEGWRVGTFKDIIHSTLSGDWGKECKQGNYIQKVFCIRGADIPNIKRGDKGNMPTRFIIEKNFQSKALMDGDMVIEVSGGSPTQATGRACRISRGLLDKYNHSIVCTNFCRAIKPLSQYSSFLYYMWEMFYNQGIMFSYENGTTGIKNLDINGLIQKEPIIIPPVEIALEFKKITQIYYEKIQSNGVESEKLSQLRNTLLPRLMSGELKISDIDNKNLQE